MRTAKKLKKYNIFLSGSGCPERMDPDLVNIIPSSKSCLPEYLFLEVTRLAIIKKIHGKSSFSKVRLDEELRHV